MGEVQKYYGPHNPTDETRAQVKALAQFGIRRDEIARFLGISQPTLRRHYATELADGVVEANLAVARVLYKSAIDGNTAAQIFWLKSRAGWSERVALEIEFATDEDDDAIDWSKVSTEALREILASQKRNVDDA